MKDELSTNGLAQWLRTDHTSVRKLRRNGVIPFRGVQRGTRTHYYYDRERVLKALGDKYGER